VEAGPKEMGTSRVRSLPGSEFFTRKVSRRLTIFVCTYLLKQVLQTGSVRTEIATGSVWQRLQRLGVVVVVVVGSAGGGGGEAVRDGILIFLIFFPVEMLGRLLFPCEVGRA
jgi:hypothetical protein